MPYREVGCPRCGKTFAAAPEGKTECAHCGGVWVDAGTLAKLWDAVHGRKRPVPELVTRTDRERPRRCALCQKDMDKVMLDAVSIDRCAGHEVVWLWFDRGELDSALSSALLDVYNRVDFEPSGTGGGD